MSSYGVIIPHSRLLFIVNPRHDDYVDSMLVITRSKPESPVKVQEYEEGTHLMLLNEWHSYKTIYMELVTNNGSIPAARLLDGSQLFGDGRDPEAAMMIAGFVVGYESRCKSGFSGEENVVEYSVEIRGDDKEEVEEEEEICVICQTEFEAGEVCQALECGHWYHKECIDKWVRHGSFCPICREAVFSL